MEFTSELEPHRGTTTGFVVPDEVVEVELPEALAAALDADPSATAFRVTLREGRRRP